MSYPKLDLRPRSLRERWFQYVVNGARHGLWIVVWALAALGCFIWAARSDDVFVLAMGIMWMMIALVWLERNIAYHVCKRLQESDSGVMTDEQAGGGADGAASGSDEG